MYVYNEEEGKVVQFRRSGDGGDCSKWHSLDSLDSRYKSVGDWDLFI